MYQSLSPLEICLTIGEQTIPFAYKSFLYTDQLRRYSLRYRSGMQIEKQFMSAFIYFQNPYCSFLTGAPWKVSELQSQLQQHWISSYLQRQQSVAEFWIEDEKSKTMRNSSSWMFKLMAVQLSIVGQVRNWFRISV